MIQFWKNNNLIDQESVEECVKLMKAIIFSNKCINHFNAY